MSKSNVVKLDVREDLRNGREPFGRIMQAVSGLEPGQDFLLLAPFEPTPLYHVLGAQGFDHASRELENGDWEIQFSRSALSDAPAAAPAVSTGRPRRGCQGPPVLEVDARGLEPPEPMVKILEAVSTLPVSATIRALTDRKPMHLYDQLAKRGFTGETEAAPDGGYVTRIRRAE